MNPGYHLKRASTNREIDHQVSIAARQDARLRFFRKREAAAWRQADNAFNLMREYGGAFMPEHHALVAAVSVQQRRNRRLGIA